MSNAAYSAALVAFKLLGYDYSLSAQGKAIPSAIGCAIGRIARIASVDPAIEAPESVRAIGEIESLLAAAAEPRNFEPEPEAVETDTSEYNNFSQGE